MTAALLQMWRLRLNTAERYSLSKSGLYISSLAFSMSQNILILKHIMVHTGATDSQYYCLILKKNFFFFLKKFIDFFFFFKQSLIKAVEDGLKLQILLPPSPHCWDYRHALPRPGSNLGSSTCQAGSLPTEPYCHLGGNFMFQIIKVFKAFFVDLWREV